MASRIQELASQQIARHGKDRYPTPRKQAEKVLLEAAELLGAIIEHNSSRSHRRNHDLAHCPLVLGESADVGLSLAELMNKLALDLDDVVLDLVSGDTRDFRDERQP